MTIITQTVTWDDLRPRSDNERRAIWSACYYAGGHHHPRAVKPRIRISPGESVAAVPCPPRSGAEQHTAIPHAVRTLRELPQGAQPKPERGGSVRADTDDPRDCMGWLASEADFAREEAIADYSEA